MMHAQFTSNKVLTKPVFSKWIGLCVVYLLPVFFLTDSLLFADGPLIGVHVAETGDEAHFESKVIKSRELGVKVIRLPVDWIPLQPDAPESGESGIYNPHYVDLVKTRVALAQANALKVVMMFSQSPEWANGGKDPQYPPLSNHYQDYAEAMAFLHGELVDQSDDFDIAPSSILAWEVWNEPNSTHFWPTASVRTGAFVLVELSAANEYAQMLATSYDKMKEHYPGVTILGGSLVSADTEYLQSMYTFWEGTPKFDHLSLHPYTRADDTSIDVIKKPQYPNQCNVSDPLSPPWCFKQGIENIRQLLNNNGDDAKQIWLTEFGTSSSAEFGGAGSNAEQKEHMKRALNVLNDWFIADDAMNIPVAITYRLEDEDEDLAGLFTEGLAAKPVSAEIIERIDSAGKLITGVRVPDKSDEVPTPDETPNPAQTPTNDSGGGGGFGIFWMAFILLMANRKKSVLDGKSIC